MNTLGSDRIIERFRARPSQAARRKLRWVKEVAGTVDDVFPLLCPSREADWIPGWDAELLFTNTGYAERDCVFRTDPDGTVGQGVWVFTRHEEGRGVELVKFTPEVLVQLRIQLEDAGEGRTRMAWEYILTGLTEEGNALVDGAQTLLESKEEAVTSALDYYLGTGEKISS